jgi:hypothetical protein
MNQENTSDNGAVDVSTSDPPARAMLHQPDGGLALSYNAQISTDSTYGLMVGVQ